MRYFIELAYKGTNYHGWQIQPNAISVQECIQKALSIILRSTIEVSGAGRTDAGVHAEQLFAHFDFPSEINSEETTYKANAVLPDDITIFKIFRVTENAHARFDAENRSYEYRILLGRNPFDIETTWQLINKKLNIEKMNMAAQILLTYTDFQCFSRSNTDVRTYNCKVTNAEWKLNGNSLIFYISADRFLRNMVRAIVGTLIDVGEGKTTIKQFIEIIKSKDRCKAGPSAPALGLFLTNVTYPKSILLNE
ncbi:tRNA pseudouridine(38-40) synthase TruA [Lutibacter sp. TH_r2]|uniref:tRNA pseudouridine(38-40) synthase TruA n=1 Tax=Lutibacter sp. TH_r2 TaxID=3082083 RepID=UPI002954A057|nr:tRNA pseudouridine(38-40) synthase TruA [Lutibacter sp. TH_r2]MDV7185846.1 tRNA pseudouridine(38-40) synthase TruA [Lutibacter sp. TH_r2]